MAGDRGEKFRRSFGSYLDDYMARARNHTIITKEKATRIVNLIKGDCADSQLKFYTKNKGLHLRDFPELGLKEVLCVPVKIRKNASAKDNKDLGMFGPYRRVAVKEEFFDILFDVHTQDRSLHHIGYKRSFRELAKHHANIPRNIVTQFCKMCQICQKKAAKQESPNNYLALHNIHNKEEVEEEEASLASSENSTAVHPLQITADKFMSVGKINIIDIQQLFGLKKTPVHFTFLIHYLDLWSNYSIFWPTKDLSVTEMASQVIARVFSYFGAPQHIVVEHDKMFTADLATELSRQWAGAVSVSSSADISRVERQESDHSLVQSKIGECLKELLTESWEVHISYLQYAVNTDKSGIKHEMPFRKVFGCTPVSKIHGSTIENNVSQPYTEFTGDSKEADGLDKRDDISSSSNHHKYETRQKKKQQSEQDWKNQEKHLYQINSPKEIKQDLNKKESEMQKDWIKTSLTDSDKVMDDDSLSQHPSAGSNKSVAAAHRCFPNPDGSSRPKHLNVQQCFSKSTKQLNTVLELSKISRVMCQASRNLSKQATVIQRCSSVPGKVNTRVKRKYKRSQPVRPSVEPCHYCKRLFADYFQIYVHIRHKHQNEPDIKDYISECREKMKIVCDKCGLILANFARYREHVIRKHEKQSAMQCHVCNKTFSNYFKLKAHAAVHRNKKFTCHICSAMYKYRSSLKAHVKRVHQHVQRKTCNICGKRFNRKTYLEWHEMAHRGLLPYSCNVCQKPFVGAKHLAFHMQVRHDKIAPFVCSFCDKGFSTKLSMVSHVCMDHFKCYPYKCSACKAEFARMQLARKHMRKCHGSTNGSEVAKILTLGVDEPLVCPFCGDKPSSRLLLVQHVQTAHKDMFPYVCGLCDQGFKEERFAIQHVQLAHRNEEDHSSQSFEIQKTQGCPGQDQLVFQSSLTDEVQVLSITDLSPEDQELVRNLQESSNSTVVITKYASSSSDLSPVAADEQEILTTSTV